MKRILKKVILIIIMLVVIWCGIFITDYIRCGSLKEPIFVVAGDTADDGGSGTYYGLGYSVNVKKHISVQYGTELDYVEMKFLNKIVSASIT